MEAEWKPWHNQPRCGHVAKNTWGRAFNTGIFAVRNNPETLKLLALWRDFLQDPERLQVRVRWRGALVLGWGWVGGGGAEEVQLLGRGQGGGRGRGGVKGSPQPACPPQPLPSSWAA